MSQSVNDNQSVGNNMAMGMQGDDEISLLDLLQTIVDNLRLLVLGPLAAGFTVLGISFLIPPTYTAKTQFLPPQQQQSVAANMLASLGSLGGLAGAVGGIKNPADQFLAFMKSVTLQDSLIDRFDLIERYGVKSKTDARLMLTDKVRLIAGKEGLISVEVDDKDPQIAADIANAHVEELDKLIGKLAISEAQQRRLFIEKQLDITKDKLIKSEIALKATGVSVSVLKSNPTSALSEVAGLQASITALELKLGTMRGYFAETAPDIKQVINELEIYKALLAKREKETPSNLLLSKEISPGDYITKYREFKYYETLFELFTKQFDFAKIEESREGGVIQVVDVATVPDRKSKPKKALLATVTAFIFGLALLIFIFSRQALSFGNKDDSTASKLEKIKNSWLRETGFT